MTITLGAIPAKRYFTIGEVAQLCGVKPHVLRYWEQEFTQLRPMKRRGNRRYYQRHEVLVIRRIRDLLYDQGFTISGARNQLQELGLGAFAELVPVQEVQEGVQGDEGISVDMNGNDCNDNAPVWSKLDVQTLREELLAIHQLLNF